MISNLQFVFLYILFFITSHVTCQIDSNYDEESKKIDSIYSLLNSGNSNQAFINANKISSHLKNNRAKANLNLFFGYYYNGLANVDSSTYFTKKALKYSEVKNDSLTARLTILAYNLFALNTKIKGLYHESKKWHLLGIKLSEKHNETNLYYTHIHGLASSYMGLNQDEKALDMFKACLQQSNQDEDLKLGAYINLGRIYSSLDKFEQSNKYLLEAKAMCTTHVKQNALANIMLNLGDNLLSKGNKNEALNIYYDVKDICIKNNYNELYLVTLEKLGTLLINEGELDLATVVFLESLTKSMSLNLLRPQMNSYRMLETIAYREKNYKNAYFNNKNYFTIKDSIEKLQKEKEINQLEIKYQSLEKEKAIKLLRVENINKGLKIRNKDVTIEKYKLQKNIIEKENENTILTLQNKAEKRKGEISILKEQERIKEQEIDRQKLIQIIAFITFAILLIPIIGLLINYYQKVQVQSLLLKKEKEISTQKITSLIKDQKLKLIKASIKGQNQERRNIAQEMHDNIGGNLAAIKLQFSQFNNDQEKMELIHQQLDATYEQVRDLSHNLIPKKIIETNFVFLIREHMRSVEEACNMKVDLAFFPEEELSSLHKELQNHLFSICQELTTNTIKHASAKKIDLQIDLSNESLFFIYEDDGNGFNTQTIDTGIGLSNIKNRVKATDGTLNIDSHPNRGTIINIIIPNRDKLNEV